jgi:hypothetical protein
VTLAFKRSSGGFFDKLIVWKTKGPLVHVELWLTGARENAECFSSRQPHGTGYAHVNLTNYVCIEIPATQLQMDETRLWCAGVGWKRYNWTAILGFVAPSKIDDRTDMTCSECCTKWAQDVMDMFPAVDARTVSPMKLFDMLGGKL